MYQNLINWLNYFSDIVVDQNQALRFAIDIARGMEFLHTLEPGVPNLVLTSKHVMVSRCLSFFHYKMDLSGRKPVFRISDKVRLKSVCSATETR